MIREGLHRQERENYLINHQLIHLVIVLMINVVDDDCFYL